MGPEAGDHETGVVDRLALPLAVGGVVVVLGALSIFAGHPIADEAGHHLPAIRQFYEGDWSRPEHLPMLPAYHAFAAVAATHFGANLIVLRGLSTAMMIGAILFYRAALRQRAVDDRGHALLHFAWLPLLLPFAVLVYTESASMLCLTAALYLHSRRRLELSGLALLLACLIRQSNVVWVVVLAALAMIECGEGTSALGAPDVAHGPRHPRRRVAARLWGHAVVAILAGIWFLADPAGARAVEANRPRFNPAQFYLFALAVILLWAPVWIGRLGGELRALRTWSKRTPARSVGAILLGIAATALLAVLFQNPHPWNENPRYFRNLPLMAMAQSWPARLTVSGLIVAAAPIVVRFTLAQPTRRMLGLVWLFTLLFLVPHSLAEPRYYVVPVVLLNLLTRFTASQARAMTLWCAATTVAVVVVVVLSGDPSGGVL